jgi:hypothetical protein
MCSWSLTQYHPACPALECTGAVHALGLATQVLLNPGDCEYQSSTLVVAPSADAVLGMQAQPNPAWSMVHVVPLIVFRNSLLMYIQGW